MEFDIRLGYCEPQPHTAVTAGKMVFHLVEALEDTGKLACRNANSRIGDRDLDITRLFTNLNSYNSTRLRILDRVLDLLLNATVILSWSAYRV